jgi:hypothetical protein
MRNLIVVISVAFAVSACAGAKTSRPQDMPLEMCSGGEGCAVVGGAMLLFHAATTPTSTTRRKTAPAIFGRCEVLIQDEKSKAKPVPQPCSQVLLKIRQNGQDIRDAWVDGFDFEIGQLKSGKYDIEAYSEQYDVRAKLKDIKTGTDLKIELRLSKK